MLTLYLIRHGETTWNAEKRMQGWSDAPLTLKGVQSAQNLGRRLKDVQFKAIYTSTSGRSVHTGSLIYNAMLQSNPEYLSFDLPIHTDPRLREMFLGPWEGELIDRIKTQERAAMEAFWNSPATFSIDGSETVSQVKERATEFLSSLLSATLATSPISSTSKAPNTNIMVVSHTIWIKVALAIINKQPLNEIWKSTYIQPSSLSLIEIPDGSGLESAKVTMEGDMSHWSF